MDILRGILLRRRTGQRQRHSGRQCDRAKRTTSDFFHECFSNLPFWLNECFTLR
jgi:hypothetical protein